MLETFKNSDFTFRQTLSFSVIKTDQKMLCGEIIAACSKFHTNVIIHYMRGKYNFELPV